MHLAPQLIHLLIRDGLVKIGLINNTERYSQKLHTIPSTKHQIGSCIIFQHDNNPKQCSKSTPGWKNPQKNGHRLASPEPGP